LGIAFAAITDMAYSGRVVRIVADKAFGFIKPNNGPQLFVHFNSVVDGRELVVNDVVMFDILDDATTGKTKAVNVSGATGQPFRTKGKGGKGGKEGKGGRTGLCVQKGGVGTYSTSFHIRLPPIPTLGLLSSVLDNCQVASRASLAAAAETFARSQALKAVGRGSFRFIPAGSVYMQELHFAKDLDIMLLCKDPQLTAVSVGALVALSQRTFVAGPISVRRLYCDGTECEVPWHEVSARELEARSSEYDAVVLTGVFRIPREGWEVPMDITVSCGDKKESKEHRLSKIQQKVAEGDYAKVLQKVRSLLKNDKDLRSVLCDAVNREVGKLRFLVMQLQLKGGADAAYMERQLGLAGLEDPRVRTAWSDFAWAEMQQRARNVLGSLRPRIGSVVPGFLAATEGV